jgi:CcmD family protein
LSPPYTMLKRFLRFVVVATLLTGSAASGIAARQPSGAPGQPPEAQGEFLPVSELPPADQLRAAPLLIAAYAFVWVAVLFYVWTIWRRLNKVEKDMEALARRSTAR